jgi:kynurenine 3-monooxygenase
LESTRRSWSGDAVREIAIPMDKRAIHVDKLNFQNYGQEESIYSISRGILNRKMIDLAKMLVLSFSLNKNLGCYTLSDATLHIGETERGAWEDKKVRYGIWC